MGRATHDQVRELCSLQTLTVFPLSVNNKLITRRKKFSVKRSIENSLRETPIRNTAGKGGGKGGRNHLIQLGS